MVQVWDGKPVKTKDNRAMVWVEKINGAVTPAQAAAMGVSIREQPPGSPAAVAAGVFADPESHKEYRKKVAGALGDAAAGRLVAARNEAAEAYNNDQTMAKAERIASSAPTGSLSAQRAWLGNSWAGDLVGGHFGIPDKVQTKNLDIMRALASKEAISKTKQLTGALSNKDVEFLMSMGFNPDKGEGFNLDIIADKQYANRKKQDWAKYLSTWTDKLGSPDARNGAGETADEAFARWHAAARPRSQLSYRDQQNAALKARSARARGGPVLLGVRRGEY